MASRTCADSDNLNDSAEDQLNEARRLPVTASCSRLRLAVKRSGWFGFSLKQAVDERVDSGAGEPR